MTPSEPQTPGPFTACHSLGKLDELGAALAKAQGQMETSKKDHENPYFSSKYADLASIWRVIRKPLTENNIAVIQLPVSHDPKTVTVITMLIHGSGQWISGSLTMPVEKQTAQAIGSVIKYARRYCLEAIVQCIQEDDPEDDDAEGATSHKPTNGKKRPKRPKPTGRTMNQWTAAINKTTTRDELVILWRQMKALAAVDQLTLDDAGELDRIITARGESFKSKLSVNADEIGIIEAAWRKKWATGDEDETIALWETFVKQATSREFDISKAIEWTAKDFAACTDAMDKVMDGGVNDAKPSTVQ